MHIGNAVTAQKKGHEIIAANKDFKISMHELLGDWFKADSSAHKIQFTAISEYFVDMHGITHGVGNYSFRVYGDSISVNGSAPNCPPYNCALRLISKDLLEIEFYQFLSTETTKVAYKR
ncbi:MAG: hypothetical protein ACKOZM_00550 [Flavobacteriales bacterium]